MTGREIDAVVGAAARVTQEIKKQVLRNAGRLIVAHLMGGTSGINLSKAMTDQEVESMVSVASRVLKELERQVQLPRTR
jgi:hypothetical protein